MSTQPDAAVAAPAPAPELEPILSQDALALVAELHRRFEPRRRELLAARAQRLAAWRSGAPLDFLPETRALRDDDGWTVAEPHPAYLDRRVEITGPVDRKMMINALNSGASGFMADFEDALSPTWRNVVAGQRNLIEAVRGTIDHVGDDGRRYVLAEHPATLLVRPRGWHLAERHVTIDGEPVAGAFVDVGLYLHHCGALLARRGEGAHLYLPKLEHHLEARLWNDVLGACEAALQLPPAHARATVLIETLPAAFQMDEILWELRERSAGLNAGRWDYLFSTIKCLALRPDAVLPDRNSVRMTVPFMRAYTELLVRTCHRRGAFAMGGMAALIPSRRDPAANERAIEAVRDDKRREAGDGFDGTWVAHPDVVATARAEFDRVLGQAPNQIARRRDDVAVGAAELLDVAATPGAVTEAGLRNDVAVGLRYLSSWLTGHGAAGINGLMEDAATAEICRAQLWQWIRHGVRLQDGRTVTADLVRATLDEEIAALRETVDAATWEAGRPDEARALFEQVTLTEELPDFLTLRAYELLERD